MTKTEYRSLKAKGQTLTAKQVQDKLRKARVMYQKATKRINRVVVRLPGGKLSERNRGKILAAVGREALYKEITGYIDEGRKSIIKSAFDVDREYIEDAFKDAGKTVDLSAMFDRQADRIEQRYEVKNAVPKSVTDILEARTKHVFSTDAFGRASYRQIPLIQNRANYQLSPAIWDAIDGYSDKILAIIQAELDAGTDPVKITKILEEYLAGGAEKVLGRWNDLKIGTPEYRKRLGTGGADYRTQRVVRTEMYSARRDADIQSGRMNPGATGMFTWNLSPFHNHCDICESRAAGGEYTAEQIQAMNDDIHPNCHPAGTMILTEKGNAAIQDIKAGQEVISHDGSINKVRTVYKSVHTGDMYRIETKDGIIEATGEHPFLSDGRWITADSLKYGDNLSCVSSGMVCEPFVIFESNDLPSKRNDNGIFFHVFELFDSAGVPSAAVHFNGKLFLYECEIDIKNIDGIIRNRIFSEFFERIIKGELVFTGAETRSSNGTLDAFLVGTFLASDSIVCGSCISLSSACIATVIPLGDIRRIKTVQNEVIPNNSTTDTNALRYLVYREILLSKEPINSLKRNVNLFTHNSAIVGVTKKTVNTIVYNLEVDNVHTFIANGFASHNCGCYAQPVLKDRDEFVQSLRDYVRGDDTPGAAEIDAWAAKYGFNE